MMICSVNYSVVIRQRIVCTLRNICWCNVVVMFVQLRTERWCRWWFGPQDGLVPLPSLPATALPCLLLLVAGSNKSLLAFTGFQLWNLHYYKYYLLHITYYIFSWILCCFIFPSLSTYTECDWLYLCPWYRVGGGRPGKFQVTSIA